MKYIYTTIVFIIALLPAAHAAEGDAKNKVSKVFTTTEDLKFYLVDTGYVNVTWTMKYSSDDKTFTITDSDVTKDQSKPDDHTAITLQEPLRLDIFTDKVNEYLHKYKNVANAADKSSVYAAFTDLRMLAYGEDQTPVSGVLYLNDYAFISTLDDDKDPDYEERKHLIDSVSQATNNAKVKADGAKKQLQDYATDRIQSFKLNGKTLTTNQLIQDQLAILTDSTRLHNSEIIIGVDANEGDVMDAVIDSIAMFSRAFQEAQVNYTKAVRDEKGSGVYKIKEVQFVFERGFLERIQVTAAYKTGDEIFENAYAIGFSSPGNYRALNLMKLYVRNSSDHSNTAPHIYLSDVIHNYKNFVHNFNRDFSPGDTSLAVSPDTAPAVTLRKEKLINLFEAKAFTDLVGLGANNPNGLIQLQIERRFNLFTTRYHITTRSDYGYFNYLNLIVNASKLENKERRLILKNQRVVDNNTVVSPSYATNMDFLRYENLNIRLEVNAFLIDCPEGKFTFNVDLGAKYGYTPVVDSVLAVDSATHAVKTPTIANNYDAHNFTVYPKFWFEFLPDPRFSLTVGYQLNTTWVYSNNLFKQVVSYSGKGGDLGTLPLNYGARFTHEIELTGRIDPNPKSNTGKIFTVARFYLQNHDVNTFFAQIQIGYAYNLIFKK